MRITVIGAGYVGLVTGACLSSTGNDVTIVDQNSDRVEGLKNGVVPIFEPGLDQIVNKGFSEGRIHFTTETAFAVKEAEIVFLAVGTPSRADGSADLSYIDEAAQQVGRALQKYTVIVTKSTVPVGTHARITKIVEGSTQCPFDYVSNPEFLREGSAVSDFMKPNRVILGTTSEKARRIMYHLYAPYVRRDDRVLVMDPASAELTKYACNAMLATRISFMNDLSRLCERVGADVTLVRHGMGSDHRIGPDFLYASLGYGGSCFPKDIRALMHIGRQEGLNLGVVQAVHEANDEQLTWMCERVVSTLGGDLRGKKLAVWGLAFKAGTDDVRESPAIKLVQALLRKGASIRAYDPKAMSTARAELGESIEYASSMYDALTNVDALVICTEWLVFRSPDFDRIASLMSGDTIIDGRNLYDIDWMSDVPLNYHSVGRASLHCHPAS